MRKADDDGRERNGGDLDAQAPVVERPRKDAVPGAVTRSGARARAPAVLPHLTILTCARTARLSRPASVGYCVICSWAASIPATKMVDQCGGILEEF